MRIILVLSSSIPFCYRMKEYMHQFLVIRSSYRAIENLSVVVDSISISFS